MESSLVEMIKSFYIHGGSYMNPRVIGAIVGVAFFLVPAVFLGFIGGGTIGGGIGEMIGGRYGVPAGIVLGIVFSTTGLLLLGVVVGTGVGYVLEGLQGWRDGSRWAILAGLLLLALGGGVAIFWGLFRTQ